MQLQPTTHNPSVKSKYLKPHYNLYMYDVSRADEQIEKRQHRFIQSAFRRVSVLCLFGPINIVYLSSPCCSLVGAQTSRHCRRRQCDDRQTFFYCNRTDHQSMKSLITSSHEPQLLRQRPRNETSAAKQVNVQSVMEVCRSTRPTCESMHCT